MNLITIAVLLIVLIAIFVVPHALSLVTKEEGGKHLDPVRMFAPYVRFETFRRAEQRCEYVTWTGRRCPNKAEHADHWIPWSKGGASSEKNCVALCSPCNLAKTNDMPTKSETKRLYKSRRYMVNRFYPGEVYGSYSGSDSYWDLQVSHDEYADNELVEDDYSDQVPIEGSESVSTDFYDDYVTDCDDEEQR